MKIKILSKFHYLNITNDIELEQFTISNDLNKLAKNFVEPFFNNAIGQMELNAFCEGCHLYYIGTAESLGSDFSNFGAECEKINRYIHRMISMLWLIKDNSINLGACYLIDVKKPDIVLNKRYIVYSNSSGKYENASVSSHEMAEALQYYHTTFTPRERKAKPVLSSVPLMHPEIIPSPLNYIHYDSFDRIDRSFIFLDMARSSSLLPLKISCYIAVFECLFTIDATEVSYKVTERGTLFLGGDRVKKDNTYNTIKEAYTIRSKFMHGQKLGKKYKEMDSLVEVSNKIDSLTREILKKIIVNHKDTFLKDDDELNIFFKNLIFS
ncbi:MAG: hypothetical protein ABIN91_06615 [Mucilaginibacter sp.]|uniref:hypothetical protein n=1 Tax=Mucilaginibacter sp. TaxID=1882438 RepID=UPI0032672951